MILSFFIHILSIAMMIFAIWLSRHKIRTTQDKIERAAYIFVAGICSLGVILLGISWLSIIWLLI